MIYWFSGTGNSLWVAETLSNALHEDLHSMAESTRIALSETADAYTGLVFPVYGWGLPKAVADFIDRLPQSSGNMSPAVYAVLTCGDDIGRTDRLLRKMLRTKGYELRAIYSVQLRNTYVCLPFFDTDSPAVEAEKQTKAESRLHEIARSIAHRAPSTPADIHPGVLPGFKSYVLRPLFNLLLTNERHFKLNPQLCTRCKRCMRNCPLHNITPAADGTPQWGSHCTHCLACYHSCPQHAINYGWFTKGKGRVAVTGHPAKPQNRM